MTSRPLSRRVNESIKARKSRTGGQTRLQDVHRVVNDLHAAGQAVYYRDKNGQKQRLPLDTEYFTCPSQSSDWDLPDQSDDDLAFYEEDEVDRKPRLSQDLNDDRHGMTTSGAASSSKVQSARRRRSLAMQRSDSHRSVRRADDEMRSERTRSNVDEDDNEDDCDMSDEDAPLNFAIGDTAQLDRFYRWIFSCIQELSLKYILKDWIKELEPKKSRNYPYCNGPRAAPPWWPLHLGVEHREPDHLKKKPRHALARCLITYAMDPKFEHQGIDRLRHSTSNTKLKFDTDGKHADVRADRRREFLNQLYDVMDKEFMLKEDNIDEGEYISIRNLTLISMRDARVSKRGKRSRAKYTTSERVLDATHLPNPSARPSSQDAPLNYHSLATPEHHMSRVPPPHIKSEPSDGLPLAFRKDSLKFHHSPPGQMPLPPGRPFPADVSNMVHVPFNAFTSVAYNMAHDQLQGFPTPTIPYSFDGTFDVTMTTTPALSMGSSSTASPREQNVMHAPYDATVTAPSPFYAPPSGSFDGTTMIPGHAPAMHMPPQPHYYDQSQHRYIEPAPPTFPEPMQWGQPLHYDHDQKYPIPY